jgi:hypothetical protein
MSLAGEGSEMRFVALILAVFVVIASASASAEGWKEYTYPGDAFGVSFPADPVVETTTYQAADGRSVAARVYSLKQDTSVFSMTIADLSDAGMEENIIIDHAIKSLSQGGEIKVDIPHRVSQVYGRQLSIAGADGSRSLIALFYHKHRLYQLEGKVMPADKGGTGDAIRFQQSLIFIDGTSNRFPIGTLLAAFTHFFETRIGPLMAKWLPHSA